MKNWYVIYTHAGKELYSANELRKQDFKIYAKQRMTGCLFSTQGMEAVVVIAPREIYYSNYYGGPR